MQAPVAIKGLVVDHLKITLIAAGVLATAITGATAVSLTNDSDRVSAPREASPITADQAYTIEAELANQNRARADAVARQLTSDTAYAVEAGQVALQQATQARRLTLTPDEAWIIEQALMETQVRHHPQGRSTEASAGGLFQTEHAEHTERDR
jgi:hypothetical protein